MRAAEIITTLASGGVTLSSENGYLHARPGHRLTDDDVRTIRQHKPVLIDLLRIRFEADEAGRQAAGESPRELTPTEKANVARLCRQHYCSGDEAIQVTIESCENCPALRDYLLAMDRC